MFSDDSLKELAVSQFFRFQPKTWLMEDLGRRHRPSSSSSPADAGGARRLAAAGDAHEPLALALQVKPMSIIARLCQHCVMC